jgi:outer membrane receptor protein involved in Fe transport
MTVNENFAFFGSVRNVFNTAPPPLPSSTLNIATNGQYYDTLGTFFQAGFRVKF